jgi:hypothetical protein
MKLTDVLTASNMNPDYYKFIPIFIKTWKKILPEVNIHIIVIADDLIKELIPYKEHIKLFSPIENIETSFIAQNIRLFYPALLKKAKGGILITDMDIIPMSKKYYIESITNIENNKFVCYRPLSCVGKNEMVMCYNIAHQNVWSEIFNINSLDDIVNTLLSINKKDKYIGENANVYYKPFWITDQLYLYEKTQEWNKLSNNLIILDNDKINKFTRLDKIYINYYTKDFIKNNNFIDFHMPRPYNSYKQTIDNIVESI